jgi:hypothetical protein
MLTMTTDGWIDRCVDNDNRWMDRQMCWQWQQMDGWTAVLTMTTDGWIDRCVDNDNRWIDGQMCYVFVCCMAVFCKC